jgi:spermidine synthase
MKQNYHLSTDVAETDAIIIERSPQISQSNFRQRQSVRNADSQSSGTEHEPGVSRHVLFVLFALSGFSGLIYESIWTHYLKLFLGHAAYAQTLVLVIFMGGMAIGSWFAARYSKRLPNLLLAYAIVEGIIGICALSFHGLFTAITNFSYSHIIPFLPSVLTVSMFKWSLATILILPQSVLLGMTFPLMSGGLLRRFPSDSGSTIAMLYFTNSIGAVAGILTSGFLLIALIGLPGTMLAAGLINIALALLIWLLSKGDIEIPLTAIPEVGKQSSSMPVSPQLLLMISLITGASSFMYEIAWIRMLSLVLGSSTHSFEIMLSAFILGLACGGLWIKRRIDHIRNQLWFLGIVQLLMGILALATLPLYSQTFKLMSFFMSALGKTDAGYLLFNVSSHAISIFIMLPATFCAGMTLPLLTAILLGAHQGEKAIGHVYAANTIGAIVGVLFAVHGLMPFVGIKGVITCGAALDIVLGWLLLRTALSSFTLKPLFGPIALGTAALTIVITSVHLDPYQMASGVYRYGRDSVSHDDQVFFFRDGKTATVSLTRDKAGYVAIATNGKPDASIQMLAGKELSSDEITMSMLAATALGFKLEAQTIANVGMGSGMTSHILLASPHLQRLDTIEIEPAMVAAAAQGFRPRIEAPFSDPRSHIHYEDAKSFFSARQHKYDVIVSEPSNPWVSGVAGLFSREFYQELGNYLQTDGILVQWIHQYEFTVDLFASVVQALSLHFSDYVMFSTNDRDIVIVAKKNGVLGSLDAQLFKHGKIVAELAKVGINGEQDIDIRRVGDKKVLAPLFQSYRAPANSDYFPYVDLYAAQARFTDQKADLITSLGLAPLPLLEMIGTTPLWLGKDVSASSHFTRSTNTVNARVLQTMLLGQSVEVPKLFPFKEHALATLLSLSSQSCAPVVNSDVWLESLFTVSEKLLPYLSPQELQPVWEKIAPAACISQLSERHKQWLTLLMAVGNRNAETMAFTAGTILENPVEKEKKDRYRYLVGAQLLGLLAQGKSTEAQTVWKEHAPRFVGEDSYLRLLSAQSFLTPTSGHQ